MTLPAPPPPPPRPPRLPLRRLPGEGYVAGVCAGIAERLGIDVLYVRTAFVVLTVTGLVGLPTYLLLWAFVDAPQDEAPAAPARLRRTRGMGRLATGTACLVLAALLALREAGLWVGDAVAFPLTLVLTGLALTWSQVARRSPAPAAPGRPRDGAPVAPAVPTARERAATLSRTGAGLAMLVAAGLLALGFSGALEGIGDALLLVVVVLLAVGIALAPFGIRTATNLREERAARIRSQERAEVAAHLHDSVLQTLALVQKRAEDPQAVAALARRQERELRSWLSGTPDARPDERLADALRAAAVEVEDAHGVPVDVVAVGDRLLDDRARALVSAAREAMSNAARHAGGPVSVFAEAADGRAEVFVRDRGGGFDPDAVPGDRRGVRESIVGRMARHGGRATVHSGPDGTEVELVLEDPRA